MESSKVQAIVENLKFKHRCNVYKENKIPILKDCHVSEQCKENGRHFLDRTKNPLSQYVDVIIPKMQRNEYAQLQMEHFKSFFGAKHVPQKAPASTHSKNLMPKLKTRVNTPNACIVDGPTSKYFSELIKTEQSYVHLLQDIVHNVMKPIRESIADTNKTPILDKYSFNKIFINMEDILDVNKLFLDALLQYQQGNTNETFGEILVKFLPRFDCYKVFFLGKTNSLASHTQNIKQNKNYSKFLLNKELIGSLSMSDVMIQPIQRMTRYGTLIGSIIENMDSNDSDMDYLKEAYAKIININDMHYGDSSLLNLYHLIRDAPHSLIQTRELLGYYDATELSLLTGKPSRPVTLLVFTDKIMVVKRKNANIKGKDYLDKIEEKVKSTMSSSMLQKAKEAYNGFPFEFKGWADIRAVELFQGLKGRSETFFLRTCLPEQSPNATEKECEDYFRRSDRLYSLVPNTARPGASTSVIEKKKELIGLCQKQYALAKLKDTSSELYYEDKLHYPAYTHIYNEETYQKTHYKNNILIVYVEDNYPMLDLNGLLTDDVWIVILLTQHQNGGYKPTIRSRTSLIPIRETNRDIEYEPIIRKTMHQKGGNAPLDFIDTLWNNLFLYERRLRATEAFSCINDNLLRFRARSRSRSKSLTRVASNMSIGKLFSRSRSTSPSRHSSLEQQEDDMLDQVTSPLSHVPDPIFKVATVNKQVESEFRAQSHLPTTSYPNEQFYTAAEGNTMAPRGYKPSKINTQPHYRHPTDTRTAPSEIFNREDHHFIDGFNEPSKPTQLEDILYGSTNIHQDNSYCRPNPYTRRSSVQSYNTNLDTLVFGQPPSISPESISRPPSGSSNNSSSASSETTPIDPQSYFSRPPTLGDASSQTSSQKYSSLLSHNSSICSYFDDFPSPHERYASSSSNTSYEENLMNAIDGSRKSLMMASSTSTGRRAPLHPNLYKNPQLPQQQQRLPNRACTNTADVVSAKMALFKNDVAGMIDNLINSQPQLRSQQDLDRYYVNNVRGLKTHIVSKLDEFMDDLQPCQDRQYS